MPRLNVGDVQLSVNVIVKNRNAKMELFLEVMFNVTFHKNVIIALASGPFNMPRKSVHPLRGQVQPQLPWHSDHDAGLRSVQCAEQQCTSTQLHDTLKG